ncbi:MAG: hypothetical protein M1825_004435 [Sarcosagium campestre]|nr:MAG: hypothetical protein M1825_004435 [Sarcosagium campestre]
MQISGQYYNFSNIRYGRAPVGESRFRSPQHPLRETKVQDGSTGRICYQARPGWLTISEKFLPQYLGGNTTAFYAENPSPPAGRPPPVPPADPRETEDCLFLDVFVPKKVFEEQRKERDYWGRKAPVLVWIHGGGYTAGHKAEYPFAGLIKQANLGEKTEDIIFVSINYRLGAFGFLAGSSMEKEGTLNAGLLDQKLALDWVQTFIGRFGGDSARVTVMGGSAGGGAILHHVTAYGGRFGPPPFQQAIPQSPFTPPDPGREKFDAIAQKFLLSAQVESIKAARAAPAETLRVANYETVLASRFGTFTYSVVIDGSYVPDLPGRLFLQKKFYKGVRFLIGQNNAEGIKFTSPWIRNSDTNFNIFLRNTFPLASPKTLSYISTQLYPPIFDDPDTYPYRDQLGRAALLISEAVFICNTNYLARSYQRQTYNYLFAIPPALHGDDLHYTFGPDRASRRSDSKRIELQTLFGRFTRSAQVNDGPPNTFRKYGTDSAVLKLTRGSSFMTKDPAANERCLWWQQGLYL